MFLSAYNKTFKNILLSNTHNIVSRRASRFIGMHHLWLLNIFLMSD